MAGERRAVSQLLGAAYLVVLVGPERPQVVSESPLVAIPEATRSSVISVPETVQRVSSAAATSRAPGIGSVSASREAKGGRPQR